MAKPKSLSGKIVLDNGRQLTITWELDDGWDGIKEDVPGLYPLFKAWHDEFEEAGWPDDDSPVS
jgi:hypothetical protein